MRAWPEGVAHAWTIAGDRRYMPEMSGPEVAPRLAGALSQRASDVYLERTNPGRPDPYETFPPASRRHWT